MAYQKTIPVTGQSLGETRDQIKDNFTALSDQFKINHDSLENATGKHFFLQMPEQTSAPTTAADEGAFYAAVGAAPAESNLFFRAESDGEEYQLTTSVAASVATFGVNTGGDNSGWTFLPGGLIMQYGRKTSPGNSGTVTFPVPFPSGNNPFTISVTAEGTTVSGTIPYAVTPATITDKVFNYTGGGASPTAINWIAIGK